MGMSWARRTERSYLRLCPILVDLEVKMGVRFSTISVSGSLSVGVTK